MGDETANSMNLDLNLRPIPGPEEALSDGSVSLEEFIGGVNGLRGSVRQREIQSQSNGFNRTRDVFTARNRRRSWFRATVPPNIAGNDTAIDPSSSVTPAETEETLSDGSVSLEEFIVGVNGLTGSVRQREIHPLRRYNGVDPLGEPRFTPWETNGIDQIRERVRLQEIQSQSNGFNRSRDVSTARDRRRSWFRATVRPNTAGNDTVIDPSSSVTPTETDTEPLKVAENDNNVNVEDEKIGEKENQDKGKDDDTSSFFDCNICLDSAKDPVVTCCGHLFCWPCVYQWLNLHSVANECPVCKGEVCMKTIIPIYGRGKTSCGPERDPTGPKIPLRPHARRVESVRQSITRSSISISMDELVRRLSERTEPRNPSSERLVSYFLGRGREEQPPPLDDRDSVSSIAAVIQTESQTIDTVLEIDSNVSLSTSTSRRRNGNDGARASDVDSGDSRAHRRRRLN